MTPEKIVENHKKYVLQSWSKQGNLNPIPVAKAGLFDEVDNTTIYELAEKLIEEQFALNEIKQTSYDRKNETLKTLSPIYDIALREITEDEIKRFFISKISYSQSYLDKVYQLLKVVFNEGMRKRRLFRKNLCRTSESQSQRY